jgi:hypothetical protein
MIGTGSTSVRHTTSNGSSSSDAQSLLDDHNRSEDDVRIDSDRS